MLNHHRLPLVVILPLLLLLSCVDAPALNTTAIRSSTYNETDPTLRRPIRAEDRPVTPNPAPRRGNALRSRG